MRKQLLHSFYGWTLDQFIKRKQFILFLLVGVLNTIFGYSLFALFVFLGSHYVVPLLVKTHIISSAIANDHMGLVSVAVFLSTCLGVLFNFKTIGVLVFKNSNNRLIFRFISVYVIQYFANLGLIKSFLLMSLNVYIAGAVSTFLCAILTYLLNKHFVFVER